MFCLETLFTVVFIVSQSIPNAARAKGQTRPLIVLIAILFNLQSCCAWLVGSQWSFSTIYCRHFVVLLTTCIAMLVARFAATLTAIVLFSAIASLNSGRRAVKHDWEERCKQ